MTQTTENKVWALYPSKLLIAIAIGAATTILAAAQVSPSNAFTGVWKLNVAKSQFNGDQAPVSETVTGLPDGRIDIEGVFSSGKAYKFSFPLPSGKEVPVEGIEHATVIEKRSDRTSDYTMKLGPVTITAHVVISEDGKSITRTFDATDGEGHDMHGIAVYEKK